MPTPYATLKKDIQGHLNDRKGTLFVLDTTEDTDTMFQTALEDALRAIALIRDPKSHRELFPREFMAFMSQETGELDISTGDVIELPSESLRILGGRIGATEIAAVKGVDYEWKRNESISIPTLGEPWIVVRGTRIEIWPRGHWAGSQLKAIIRYVTDPPPYESAHPAIVRAMTLAAAQTMALDKEMDRLGMILQRRANEALAIAIGLPFMASEKPSEAK